MKIKKINSKKYLIILIKIIIILLAIFGITSVFLLIKGYRPLIDESVYPDWIAINAIGQWFGAIVAIFIPIVVVYLSNRIKENIENISDKTITTIKRASSQNFTPVLEYYSSATKGKITFDYSNNNGRYCIGQDEQMFEIKFSKSSDTNIHVYNDPASISSIALVKDISQIEFITDASYYDKSSRTRCPKINEIVVLQNIHGFYAAIKILSIKDDTRSAKNDEVEFEYIIQTNGTSNFSNK